MVMKRFAVALLVAICGACLQFLAPAWSETAVSCGTPLGAGDDWPTGSPQEAGLDPAILCSLNEALDSLERDHAFLLKGDVFTKDVIETWLEYKREREVGPVQLRPSPYEFHLYFDA